MFHTCVLKRIAQFVLLTGLMSAHAAAAAVDSDYKKPMEILKKSEYIRTPEKSFVTHIDVYEYNTSNKKMEGKMQFQLYAKTGETYKALVKFLSPANQKGRLLLLNDNIFWLYIPGTRHPIRISPQQRLIGKVSYGDLVAVNFLYDYVPESITEASIDNDLCYVLQLKARRKTVSYQKITYWIEKKTYRPHKAHYYTISGRHLKTLMFKDYQPRLKKIRPTKMVISDKLNPDIVTVMAFKDIQPVNNADSMFTKQYLLKAK